MGVDVAAVEVVVRLRVVALELETALMDVEADGDVMEDVEVVVDVDVDVGVLDMLEEVKDVLEAEDEPFDDDELLVEKGVEELLMYSVVAGGSSYRSAASSLRRTLRPRRRCTPVALLSENRRKRARVATVALACVIIRRDQRPRRECAPPCSTPAMATPLSSYTCAQLTGELLLSVLLWPRMRDESPTANSRAVFRPSGMPSATTVATEPADIALNDATPKLTSSDGPPCAARLRAVARTRHTARRRGAVASVALTCNAISVYSGAGAELGM